MSSTGTVILLMIENSSLRITQIHRITGFTKASLTKAASVLESEGLILRGQDGLKITKSGKAKIQEMLTPGMRRVKARPFVLRRNDNCLYYYDCCAVACNLNWPAWGCTGCPVNDSNHTNNRGQ